ncbi:hypothetical protein DFH09DRAFT_1099227 [Mycena vulgaris]|nr:hypothetical protein DFH09DRAFT_1099227 [Mycena vulgaris]
MDESSRVLSVSVLYPAGARWLSLRFVGRVVFKTSGEFVMCAKSRGIEFVRMLVALELYEIPREEVAGGAVGVVQGGFPRGGAQRVRFPEEYPNADSCSPNRVIVSCQVCHSRVGARGHTQSVWDPYNARVIRRCPWVGGRSRSSCTYNKSMGRVGRRVSFESRSSSSSIVGRGNFLSEFRWVPGDGSQSSRLFPLLVLLRVVMSDASSREVNALMMAPLGKRISR